MPVLLALHDKEGDENDLPPVLRMIAPGWTILSPRLTWNTSELVEWLAANTSARPFALGYAAGADLAAELLMMHEGVLAGAILLRPSESVPSLTADIEGAPVAIITSGDGECMHLARRLSQAGARVDMAVNAGERSLTPQDFAMVKQWLENQL